MWLVSGLGAHLISYMILYLYYTVDAWSKLQGNVIFWWLNIIKATQNIFLWFFSPRLFFFVKKRIFFPVFRECFIVALKNSCSNQTVLYLNSKTEPSQLKRWWVRWWFLNQLNLLISNTDEWGCFWTNRTISSQRDEWLNFHFKLELQFQILNCHFKPTSNPKWLSMIVFSDPKKPSGYLMIDKDLASAPN